MIGIFVVPILQNTAFECCFDHSFMNLLQVIRPYDNFISITIKKSKTDENSIEVALYMKSYQDLIRKYIEFKASSVSSIQSSQTNDPEIKILIVAQNIQQLSPKLQNNISLLSR